MNRKTYIIFVLMIIIAGGVIDNSSIVNNNIVPGGIESLNGLPETVPGKNNDQELGTEQKNTNNCIEGPRGDPVLESLAGIRHCDDYGQ